MSPFHHKIEPVAQSELVASTQSASPPIAEGMLAITFPLTLLFIIFLYKQYRVAILRRRTAALERLWQLESPKRTR